MLAKPIEEIPGHESTAAVVGVDEKLSNEPFFFFFLLALQKACSGEWSQ